MNDPLVVEVTRGSTVESIHLVDIALPAALHTYDNINDGLLPLVLHACGCIGQERGSSVNFHIEQGMGSAVLISTP